MNLAWPSQVFPEFVPIGVRSLRRCTALTSSDVAHHNSLIIRRACLSSLRDSTQEDRPRKSLDFSARFSRPRKTEVDVNDPGVHSPSDQVRSCAVRDIRCEPLRDPVPSNPWP